MNDDDDKVGYRHPPKHHRWKKGQSGNKRGRPAGARALSHMLAQELDEKVTITENGKRRVMTRRQVAIKALVAKAMRGDYQALKHISALEERMRLNPFSDTGNTERVSFTLRLDDADFQDEE